MIEGKTSGKVIRARQVLSIDPDPQKKNMPGVINSVLGKSFLVTTGPLGAAAVSLATLYGVLIFTATGQISVWQIPAALAAIRFGHWLYEPASAVMKTPSTRRKIEKVLGDEILITLLLPAACYLMQWSLDRVTLLTFFAANLVVQTGLTHCRTSIFRSLGKLSQGLLDYRCSKQAIIVGTGKKAKELADLMLESPEMETSPVGFLDYNRQELWSYRDIPLIGHPEDFEEIASVCRLDSLVIAVEPEDLGRTHALFSSAEKMGIPVCLKPDIYRPHLAKTSVVQLNGFPILAYHAVPDGKLALLLKSIMDRAGALIGIILTAPVMLAAVIAIKLDCRGPVLFKQERTGLNGKRFTLFKFRTMCCDAEKKKKELISQNEMSGPVFKICNDPRVTRVGRILRKFSVDELPQFFNVLVGDMSLVGPRPPLPSEVAKYEPWQHRKLSVKPGVTCIWQVGGRNNIDFDDWMRLDLQYIDSWSLWLDARILAKTIPAVFKGDGAS